MDTYTFDDIEKLWSEWLREQGEEAACIDERVNGVLIDGTVKPFPVWLKKRQFGASGDGELRPL